MAYFSENMVDKNFKLYIRTNSPIDTNFSVQSRDVSNFDVSVKNI